MNFLTAQYRGRGQNRLSLAVQHFEYCGEEVCFACLAGQDAWTEALYLWFRREVLGKYFDRYGGNFERIELSLRKQLAQLGKNVVHTEANDKLQRSLAGVVCVGDEFLGFEQGEMQIFCLNTAFGRANMESLRENADGEIYVGSLQRDVALLIVPTHILQVLGEKELSDGLYVGEVSREWQMQRHLRELMNTVCEKGVSEVGAILVRSCVVGQIRENLPGVSDLEWTEEVQESWEYEEYLQEENIESGGCRKFETHAEYAISNRQLKWGRQLGQGAFAQVYKVKDGKTGAVYACKKSEDIDMLWKEYCLGRKLEHPLFTKMYDFWQEDGIGFLLMEYVPGSTVKQMLERRGAFGVAQTIRVGMELAEGLRYLHEWKYPYLFRDVKPENIIIRQDGRVKLLDLGCARRKDVRAMSRAGSPGYAAPEQLEPGRAIDETCDVYGVARTMEEMMGPDKRVYRNYSGKRGMVQFVSRRKRRLLRRQLTDVCRQCTSADILRRIPDMRTLLLMLARLREECEECFKLCKKGRTAYWYGKEWRCLKNIWDRSEETT